MGESEKLLLDFLKEIKENQEFISKSEARHYVGFNCLALKGFNFNLTDGICDNAYRYSADLKKPTKSQCTNSGLSELVSDLSKNWEHYSGSRMFPIKATALDFAEYQPEWNLTLEHDFMDRDEDDIYRFIAYNNLSQWKGSYGERRWQLVDYLIKELENESEIYSK